ncbi:hypothetical protein AALO_G00145980 [Alosa alosa]|uniref:Uncharacterized protein n=1 Tax=Alosa alosa TaxID=278164 RepID=A0AAV6GNB0_9TELE|nr:hypothetical protein AALO_G00145980 [Alosa alosa]
MNCSRAAVQSLNSLNDQIAHFMVTRPSTLTHEDQAFLPSEKDTLKQSMALMRHLLMDAQGPLEESHPRVWIWGEDVG